MNAYVQNAVLFSLFFFMISQANAQSPAEIQGKQSLGLFYTSNADLVSSGPTADAFTRLDSKWYGQVQDIPFYFGVSWYNYAKQKSNNMLSLNLSTEQLQESHIAGDYQLIPKLFHRNYISNTAATSDTSFTNTGFGLDFEKTWQKNSRLNLSALAGFESRHFHQFKNRWDHEGHITGDVQFELTSKIFLNGFSGLGLVFSSLSEYSHLFLDLGFGAHGPINADWNWNSELQITQKNYFNRTITQATEITNRRGNKSTVVSTTNESTLLNILKTSATYNYNAALRIESGLLFAGQGSNNEVNGYNNFEVFSSIIFRGP